jgi:cytochrome P450
MATSAPVWECPFSQPDALEFDSSLKQVAEQAPVARIRLPYGEGEAWLVTRHEDVRTVVTDRRFSRAAIMERDFPRITPEPIVQAEAINVMDPPAYSRLRNLVAKGFTNRHVEQMRPKTQQIVDTLLDTMTEHGCPADLVAHLSSQLPLTTISELLDIPAADRPRLHGCAVTLMSTGVPDGQRTAKAELRAYFADLTARRRRAPADDLLSALATAQDDGEFLDERELAVLGMLLLVSGHDTTTYQISNISYTLLTHPRQLAWLRQHSEQLPQAIEELLRFIPFRHGVGIPRVATEDVQLSGVTIRKGEMVHVSYLTANRDPLVFERPDELELDRSSGPHMTFGWGTHHCIGAHLARMELQVAIGTLLHRFPHLRLAVAPDQMRWQTGSIWRSPQTLPVAW